ncbi:MAG: ATP-binding protein [Bradyrhizobium sp.]|nr:ATP-binding protein [Bradyrhizobium sp.]
MKEVLRNIVDNAIKYTAHGSVTISAERAADRVRVTISDTGAGIAPEVLPHLFQKFSRADAAKANLLGSGIGLYLARVFVEAQGGRIWAESEGPNNGSTFNVELAAARQS